MSEVRRTVGRMWIHTDQGFVSVVAHDDRPDDLLVRARARGDLEALVPAGTETWRDDMADYPWRAVVRRSEFAAVMAAAIVGIDYRNFKNRTYETLGSERTHLLHDVWSTLRRIEGIEQAAATGEGA